MSDDDEKPSRELTPEELFELAIKNIDESKIYDAKYTGQAAAPLPDEPDDYYPDAPDEANLPDKLDEEAARQQVHETRDMAFFEQMIDSVEPLDGRDKYRPPRGSHREQDTEDPEDEAPPRLTTPSLPRHGEGLHHIPSLDASQRDLLREHRRITSSQKVPELNIRGSILNDAIEELREFVIHHWKQDAPFIKIIHGRGLQSEFAPVLKPAVLDWLESTGLPYIKGYAPLLTQSRDYGSLVVQLRSPTTSQS